MRERIERVWNLRFLIRWNKNKKKEKKKNINEEKSMGEDPSFLLHSFIKSSKEFTSLRLHRTKKMMYYVQRKKRRRLKRGDELVSDLIISPVQFLTWSVSLTGSYQQSALFIFSHFFSNSSSMSTFIIFLRILRRIIDQKSFWGTTMANGGYSWFGNVWEWNLGGIEVEARKAVPKESPSTIPAFPISSGT